MKTIQYLTHLICALAIVHFVASCASTEKIMEAERVDNREETGAIAVTEGSVQGTFKSVAGVMDKLSCYCNNGGYITSPNGETTAVCFDATQDVGACSEIEVSGIFETKTLVSEGNNPCPSGEMSFLRVKKYKCSTMNK